MQKVTITRTRHIQIYIKNAPEIVKKAKKKKKKPTQQLLKLNSDRGSWYLRKNKYLLRVQNENRGSSCRQRQEA